MFLAKYGSLALYDEDMEKVFIIDHKKLQYDKNAEWNLIKIPEKPDGTLVYHEYFCFCDDTFDRIQSTHQDNNKMLKLISNETNYNEYQCGVAEICHENTQKKMRTINNK